MRTFAQYTRIGPLLASMQVLRGSRERGIPEPRSGEDMPRKSLDARGCGETPGLSGGVQSAPPGMPDGESVL